MTSSNAIIISHGRVRDARAYAHVQFTAFLDNRVKTVPCWTDLWKVIVWQAKALGTSNVFIAAPPKFHKVANVTFGDMNVITLDAEKQRYLELPANFHASLVEQEICGGCRQISASPCMNRCRFRHEMTTTICTRTAETLSPLQFSTSRRFLVQPRKRHVLLKTQMQSWL